MANKLPLAWLQLTREKPRLFVALSGIAFSNILMFMQLGFKGALYDSNARFHSSLKGDLVMIHSGSKSLASLRQFSDRRLYQILHFSEVRSVSPLYVSYTSWKNPENGDYRDILVYGFNPDKPVFNISEINANLDKIRWNRNILFDRDSRSEYGNIATLFKEKKKLTTEVQQYRVNIVGLFSLGSSFAADGNIVTSDLNFIRIVKNRPLGHIDIGLITLAPGISLEEFLPRARASLPNDVKLFTHQEFIEFEKEYWRNSTAIGFIFALGTAMSFIVGIVIVYQILYTDVSDHLAEYATLKAIGYKTSYLLGVVFQEALILAILGYLPGLGISLGIYQLARNATTLPMIMQLGRALFILVLTIIMCSISGAIAVRKLQQADPAEIF
jgi:putative ABC transport system permease protein